MPDEPKMPAGYVDTTPYVPNPAINTGLSLEVLRGRHLAHIAIRQAIADADTAWADETSDPPADGLYLDHLADHVMRSLG